MIHNISRFITALALLATAQGAWAQTPSGNWNDWVEEEEHKIDWDNAEAKAAAIPQSDDGSTVYISTAEQLAYYAYAVNNDKQTSGSASGYYCGRTVELMADIDLSAHYWKPIGWNKDYYFTGYFHGNGHVITGIHVNGDPQSDKTTYYPCYGLFGYLHRRSSGTSTITDLVLKDFSITASFSGNNKDVFYLGGLVGRCDDNTAITNCLLVNGSVSKSGSNSSAHIGKVAGGGSPSTASVNYYHNVSVSGWYDGFDDYAQQTIGGETEARAVALTISSTHGSVALGGTVGRISDGIIYAPANETVTLNTTTDAGYIASLAATGLTLTSGAFTMPDNDDAAITATVSIDPAHFSQDGDTYTIKSAAGWDVFCDLLADNTKGYFTGKTVRLADDITVTRMAGGDSHDFTGTFDGDGHTLTFSHTATDNYCAPFRHVQGASAETPAVISNLNVVSTVTADDYRHPAGLIALQSGHVSVTDCNVEAHISNTKGTANPTNLYPSALVSQSNGVLTVSGCTTSGEIATDGKYAAGLVGIVQNTATIENCRASVTIQSTTSGDGTHGGLVASQSSGTTITITGCLFDGSLLGSATNKCGGFIGWRGNTATIYNSLFAPAEVTVQNDGSATFARNKVDTYNSYYTYYLCDGTNYAPYDPADADHPDKYNNGHATRTVTAAADVTIEAVALTGTATQYTVSGITAYSGGGLQRGQTLYYGSDDQLSLTLTTSAQCDQPGYQYAYTASAGTLSGTTLTMPDQDVTISVNTADLATIDWATVNQGNSADDPYMIYNKDQLLLLAHRVNGTNGETANTYQGMYFKLGADITFDHPVAEPDDYAENYEAIGGYAGGTYSNFKGNFDGDGHTVSGIRIRKTGSGDADMYQGLFGCISSGANIHDVHLTDARIKGYNRVGGIVGSISVPLNGSGVTVSGCSVTDSYITATSSSYGIICGSDTRGYSDATLRNNYYHGCTVNGTPVTSGKGCGSGNNSLGFSIADIADNNGALPAYAIALGANITTPPGTFLGDGESFATPPVDARLAPENGFTLAGNHYFASGYVFTPGSTLASGAAQGYTPRATLDDQLLDLYTPTGDAPDYTGTAIARLTITADCDGKTLKAAIRSDGQQHDVNYTEADGTTDKASAIALDGHETVDGSGDVHLAAGTYYVGTDITYANRIKPDGDITLILANGKTMTLNGKKQGIFNGSRNLTIYGQSLDDDAGTLRYDGTSYGIHVKNYEQHSGNVSITTTGSWVRGINANNDVTLRGGTLTVTANGDEACAINGYTLSILGGHLTATATNATGISAGASSGTALTLGWTRPADRITASSISAPAGGTVAVADGQALTDGSGHIYTGTLTASELSGFAAETTLQPCLALADAASNTAAITDHAGQTLAVALSGRTLYKDGSWNTLCLPFAVDLTASATLSGDNVQAMTLNTTTSNFADGTLTLNFTAATEPIPAGTPFIIKWDQPANYKPYTGQNAATCSDLVSPVFLGVTIDAENRDATVTGVLTFTGTYAPVPIPAAGDNTKLYLGAANKLYYPTKAMTIGTHRAYFQLLGDLTAGEPTSPQSSHVRAFNLNFGDDEATGIISVHDSGFTVNGSAAWYTLDGRRLDGVPTAKGLYIHGGKKVIVK